MEALGHTEEHCWWAWPLVGLVGTKGSLAPCGDLLEIYFSVWFPAVGPDKLAQSGAAFKKMASFVQRLLSLKGGCRKCQESHVNPALLSAPADGNAPLRSCGLVPLAFWPSGCLVAVLLQLIGRTLCSSLLLPKESKLFVLFPHSLLKRQEGKKGSGGSK